MLYVPRHFFVNNHVAIEKALGRDVYARLLYEAGHKSAHSCCDKVSVTYDGQSLDVFRHYLTRLSQRGWGLFDFIEIDPLSASATVRLRHSSMVLGRPGEPGKLCYMFSGWFAGAMDWVCGAQDIALRTHSEESSCQADGHDYCTFALIAHSCESP
jgi:predicted hydrocarbon binding protein